MASSTPETRAVLLTRPLGDSRAIAERLAAEGVPSEIWPLTAVRPIEMAMTVPPTVDGLLFTSAHGVQAFAALVGRRDLPALCVGTGTRDAARRAGFTGALAGGGTAEALATFASMSGLRHFFYPRGRDVSADLRRMLAARGVAVSERVVYAAEETGPPPAPVAHALASGRIGTVGLWSRRNAEILRAHIEAGRVRLGPGIAAVAISEKAADPLRGLDFAVIVVPPEPDREAMIGALCGRR